MKKLETCTEIRNALLAGASYIVLAVIFSLGLNLLFLASPLYMMQVYDRVLASGSGSTLALLTLALGIALFTLSLLDDARTKLLARLGARLDAQLAGAIFGAQFRAMRAGRSALASQAMRDFDTFRSFISGNGLHGFFDLPWLPVYVAALYLLHPLMAVLGIGAAILMLGLTLLNEVATRKRLRLVNSAFSRSLGRLDGYLRNAEAVQALGMAPTLRALWSADRDRAKAENIAVSDHSATAQSAIKFLRLFLQSIMLGLGAWLVIERQLLPGAMFAGTLLLGRALSPVEQAVGVWRHLVAARAAYETVAKILLEFPEPRETMPLPRPSGHVSVQRLVLAAPGAENPVLSGIGFSLDAGASLAIVGPSGAGKSSLLKAIAGVWQPRSGKVRLDGADMSEWNDADRGRHVGYLPQDIELFSGSVRENIARFTDAEPAEIVAAARAAGIHEMVLRLPKGYETEIGEGGASLSGGQRQRLGLARALFGDPALVLLDEPNSNLDSDGDEALRRVLEDLRSRKRTVIVVSHRPHVLALVDRILVLRDGLIEAYAPRAELMPKLLNTAGTRHAQSG